MAAVQTRRRPSCRARRAAIPRPLSASAESYAARPECSPLFPTWRAPAHALALHASHTNDRSATQRGFERLNHDDTASTPLLDAAAAIFQRCPQPQRRPCGSARRRRPIASAPLSATVSQADLRRAAVGSQNCSPIVFASFVSCAVHLAPTACPRVRLRSAAAVRCPSLPPLCCSGL